MRVEELMTKRVVTARVDVSIKEIMRIFEREHFHHIVIVDEHRKPLGVITDREILKETSPFIGRLSESDRDTFTLNKRAHIIMKREIVVTYAETNVIDACKKLIENNVTCLPVVGASGKLIGIVTIRDFLRILYEEGTRGTFCGLDHRSKT